MNEEGKTIVKSKKMHIFAAKHVPGIVYWKDSVKRYWWSTNVCACMAVTVVYSRNRKNTCFLLWKMQWIHWVHRWTRNINSWRKHIDWLTVVKLCILTHRGECLCQQFSIIFWSNHLNEQFPILIISRM